MTVKKKKFYPASPLPKNMTRYRNINDSSSYIPSFFTRENRFQFHNQNNLIIVDDQDGNSGLK